MDRKKKLETSLEGLFSRSKGAPETAEVEKKAESQAPAEAELPAKSTSKPARQPVAKKPVLKKAAEKKADNPPEIEPKTPAAEARSEAGSTPKETTSELDWLKAVIEQAKPESQPEPAPVPVSESKMDPLTETPAPSPVQPQKKSDLALASPVDSELAVVDEALADIQLLVFEIQNVQYAIDVSLVQTIIKPQAVFLVPGTADYLKGLINLRGEVVPVIDMRTRFDLPIEEVSKDTRFVVVKVDDIMASMVVDRVHGVETIPLNVIEKPSGLVMDIDNRYLTGMARYEERIILILDLMQTIRPETVDLR